MNEIHLRRFDLNLLIVFDALMRERHVGHAAERLGLTQPAVSHALGRLRQLLGDPLFVRHARGVRPTVRAEALAGNIAPLLRGLENSLQACARLDPATVERSVSIGGSDYAALVIAPLLSEQVRRQAPRLDLRFLPISADTALGGLRRREIDLAVGPVAAAPAGMRVTTLFTETLVLVARTGHRAFREPLKPETYAKLQHLLVSPRGDTAGSVDQALREAGLTRRIAVTVPHFAAAPFIVGASDLVAVLPARVARRLAAAAGVAVHELPVAVPSWSVGAAALADAAGDPVLQWVLDQMSAVCRAM
jgi:DNA-binding transcriptional LysR family regulator